MINLLTFVIKTIPLKILLIFVLTVNTKSNVLVAVKNALKKFIIQINILMVVSFREECKKG